MIMGSEVRQKGQVSRKPSTFPDCDIIIIIDQIGTLARKIFEIGRD